MPRSDPVQDIDVHPLEYGEEPAWLLVDSDSGPSPEGARRIREVLARSGPEGARCLLLAYRAGRAVGRLEGVFLNPRLYFIRELLTSDDADGDAVVAALVGYLGASFSEDGTEVLSWDRSESARVNRALERAAFVIHKEKVFVERDLERFVSERADPFGYRSLAEIGEDRFLEVMIEASTGDPFEDPGSRDPRSDFRDLIEYAGERFDPTWWRVAYLERSPVGIVLPQAFSDRTNEGTLFYVGVLPEFRGRGFGKVLHESGLGFLAARGVKRYVGSTDARNLPMIAVFRANRCDQTGRQLFYRALRRTRRDGRS
jgi:ribosomal protein S18 acetylase RimI-like enzyme